MIKNVLKGIVIGISNILPGVSGGTMAVSMGIYDKLIHCINHLFKDFKKNLLFLFPIAVGMVIAIIASAFGIDYLFETFPFQTNLLFIGVIVGIVLIARLMEFVFQKYPNYAYWSIIGLLLASPIAILMVGHFLKITLVSVVTGIITLGLGCFIAGKLGDT